MEFTIVSYGAGEVLEIMFNAIAKVINGKDGTIFQPLMRLGLTVGLLWAVVNSIGGDHYKRLISEWLLPFYMSYALFFAPTCTLHIKDPTAPGIMFTVDNVPWGLGAFAGTISSLSDAITKEIERFFSMPDDLKYHKSGAIMASRLIADAKTYRITNAEVAETMKDFVYQCVLYNAMNGKVYTMEKLRTTPDIWEFVTKTHTPSPARAFTYKNPTTGEASIVTCADGAKDLEKLLKMEVTNSFTYFGKLFFGERKKGTTPIGKATSTLMKSYLPLAFQTMTDMARSAEQIMRQQMMIYTTMDAIEAKSRSLGNAPNFAVQRAYLQQRAHQETMGALMDRKLLAMKNVMEALIYAAFLFIVPLAMLPLGWRYIGRWAALVLWINLWPPLYAIVNFLANASTRTKSLAAASLQTDTGITIANSVSIMDIHADMAGYAGFMTLSVGALAYTLIRGGAGSFVHLADHLSGPASSAVGRATDDMVSGNYSFGNISSGNIQAHNASSFQENWSPSLHSGAFSSNDGVVSRSTSADGTSVLNIASSQLRTQLNLSDTMSNSYSAQSTAATTASHNAMVAAAKSESDAYRQTLEFAHHQAVQSQSDKSMGHSTAFSSDASFQKLENLTNKFAQDHNMSYSEASELFGQVTANVGVSGGILGISGGASVSGGYGKKYQDTENHIYSEAQDYIKQHGLAETMRHAVAATQDSRFSNSDSVGKRYADSISSSLDKASSYRTEATAHLQKSHSYAEMASWARQNAGSINQNLNQEYVEWLEHQPLPNSSGAMGRHEAETILTARPDLDSMYSQHFLQTKMQGMDHYLPNSAGHGHVQNMYQGLSKDVNSPVQNTGVGAVNLHAAQSGFGEQFKLDTTPQDEVTRLAGDIQQKLNNNTANLQPQADALTKQIKEEVD